MDTVNHQHLIPEPAPAPQPDVVPQFDGESGVKPPAWEMIENGRYRPRRIRGSLLGRELG